MTLREDALKLHKDNQGKIRVESKVEVNNADDLSIAYSPGVAEPCLEIAEDPNNAYTYTTKGNMVAVITDGSAVLGLGNIGAVAGLPVMEGKAVLFKNFAGVDAFPICIESQDTDTIVNVAANISPGFGGINLEDISAPRCFEIENRLKEMLDIPVFHDDQHGTAVVTLSGIINGLKHVGKDISDCRIAISGAGAAGVAISKLLLAYGAKEILVCNSKGILDPNDDSLDKYRREIAELTNPNKETGDLADAINGADIFIGVSAADLVDVEMAKSMNDDAIVFAMANPIPEMTPETAQAAGIRIYGTGRSDIQNQINNVSAFPGIFKGALQVRSKEITQEMMIAAAEAIASLVSDDELRDDFIVPGPFDERIVPAVSKAVADKATEQGHNRI